MEYKGNPFTCFFTLTAEYIYVFETNHCANKVGIFLIEHIDFCEKIIQGKSKNTDDGLKIEEENVDHNFFVIKQENPEQFIIHFKKSVQLSLVENFLKSEM
jgi:hypothetical protein